MTRIFVRCVFFFLSKNVQIECSKYLTTFSFQQKKSKVVCHSLHVLSKEECSYDECYRSESNKKFTMLTSIVYLTIIQSRRSSFFEYEVFSSPQTLK